MLIWAILIVTLLAYLIFDYFKSYRRDKVMERLDFGFTYEEEELPSLWDGAKNFLQLGTVRQLLLQSAIIRALDVHLRRSRLSISLLQAIFVIIGLTLISSVLCYFYFKNATPALVCLLVTPILLWWLLSFLSEKQQKKMDLLLPSLINSMLTTMRAGGTPVQALHATSRNAAEPMKSSITHVLNQLQLGQSPITVWKEWSDFWDTKSARLLSTGIRVKWEAGGQMSSVLEHILETIEFRKKIEVRISTLTTQAKIGSILLTIIPPFLVYIQYLRTPELVTEMFEDDVGQKMYIFAATLTIVGFIWLRKLAKVKLE